MHGVGLNALAVLGADGSGLGLRGIGGTHEGPPTEHSVLTAQNRADHPLCAEPLGGGGGIARAAIGVLPQPGLNFFAHYFVFF